MTENGSGQAVVVNVGSCRCPGAPHDPAGDTVSLAPRLTVPMGAAAWVAMQHALATLPSMQAALTGVYLEHGIVGWSFTQPDVKGASEPVPVSAEAVERLIPWGNGGMEVAEQADVLYAEELMVPFLRRQERLSGTGPTADSTSANRSSGPPPPVPSKPSSPAEPAGRLSVVPAP